MVRCTNHRNDRVNPSAEPVETSWSPRGCPYPYAVLLNIEELTRHTKWRVLVTSLQWVDELPCRRLEGDVGAANMVGVGRVRVPCQFNGSSRRSSMGVGHANIVPAGIILKTPPVMGCTARRSSMLSLAP